MHAYSRKWSSFSLEGAFYFPPLTHANVKTKNKIVNKKSNQSEKKQSLIYAHCMTLIRDNVMT